MTERVGTQSARGVAMTMAAAEQQALFDGPDVPDFATVLGISLGTACRMRFRPYPPQRGQRMFTLELAPRSMYVLAGEVRWQWQHGVPPTPGLRYSIAFRTLGPHARKAT